MSLINMGDKDSAVTLWMGACISADCAPTLAIYKVISYIFHIAIAAISIYTLIKVSI